MILSRIRKVIVRIAGLDGPFLRNLGWQSTSSLVTIALGFIYVLTLGRFLGPAEFGFFSLGTGAVAVALQVCDLRLAESIIRYLTELRQTATKAECDALIVLALAISVVLTGLACILCSLGGAYFFREKTGGAQMPEFFAVCALMAWPSFAGNAVAIGVLRVHDRFRMLATVSISAAAGKLAVALLLFWRGNVTAVEIVVASGLVATTANIGALSLAWKESGGLSLASARRGWPGVRARGNPAVRFVGKSYLFSLMSLPMKDLDITLLGYFGQLADLGQYRIAKSFMAALWSLTDSAFLVAYPEITRLRVGATLDHLKTYLLRLSRFMGAAGLLLFFGSTLVVPVVIPHVLGPQYAGSVGYFLIMSVGILVWAPLVWVNPVLFAFDRPGTAAIGTAVGAGATLIAMIILIPTFHAYGAAIGNMAGGATGVLASLLLVRHFVLGRERTAGSPRRPALGI